MDFETTISHQTEPSQPATPPGPKAPNEQQAEAIGKIIEFIQDPDPECPMFILEGGAGTGKTFCMSHVRQAIQGSRTKIAWTAPTNKAAKELRKVTGDARTIYSQLGLRIDKSGELKELVAGERPDLSDIDVINIDEGSMVNKHLMGHLSDLVKFDDFKILFLADNAQLPPVGEEVSPIWKVSGIGHAQLTKVMRHDNQILQMATHIRQQVFSLQSQLKLLSNNDGAEGVWKLNKANFKMQIYERAAAGEFADGNTNKVISWRNVRVAEYNDVIRNGIFGSDAVSGFYLPGDRIIAAGPCKGSDDEMLLATDEEAVVTSVREAQHPSESKYKMQELKATTEDGRNIRLWTIHPASMTQWNNDCNDLAHAARSDGRLWKKFWALKDIFHEVKYAYAITAHRAQGSTYTNVFVDTGDILINRNRREALQCLYVACSRPTTCLYMA